MKKTHNVLGLIVLAVVLAAALSLSVCAVGTDHCCEEGEDPAICYYAYDDCLIAECSYCGERYDATVSLDLQEGTVFSCTTPEIKVNDEGWADIDGLSYVVLYEGVGDTTYKLSATVPENDGTYTASLVLSWAWESKNADTIESYRTTPICFTIISHEWSYSASGCTITAQCNHCHTTAKVTLDVDAIYEEGREGDKSGLQNEIFIDSNWNGQKNIAHYNVLYEGEEIIEGSKNTRLYKRTTYKPTNTGSYTAKLVLLEDENNTESVYCSTESRPFYVADIPVSQCTVLDYGPTQISEFEEPPKNSYTGRYEVSTLSQLLWCVYSGDPDITITLQNDIVVNPIVTTDEGMVYSASYQIYRWNGFGTESEEFTGTIYGNGHTIYGLYHPEQDSLKHSGFIACGRDSYVRDLKIENSYIVNVDAAALIGRLCLSDGMNIHYANNSTVYCYIKGTNCAGGHIGYYVSNGGGWTTTYFDDCINNSTIVAGKWAGGLIGKSSEDDCLNRAFFTDCANYGNITAQTYDAGGIFGSLRMRKGARADFEKCINTGNISGPSYSGGIIGYINGSNITVNVNNCISIGSISPVAKNSRAGICGCAKSDYYTSNSVRTDSNIYYGATIAYGNAPSGYENSALDTHLTEGQVKKGYLCSKYGHYADSHFCCVTAASCEEDGYMVKKCMVCGEVLATQTPKAHGHYYEGNTCIYCGEKKDGSFIASMFYQSSPVVLSVIGGLLAVFAAGAVVLTKKRKKAQTVTESPANPDTPAIDTPPTDDKQS